MNSTAINPVVTFFHAYRFNYPWHDLWCRIYDCELVYIAEGDCFQRIEQRIYRLRRGDMVIIPPGCWHQSWQKSRQLLVRYCIHFDWNRDYMTKSVPLHCLAGERYDERRVHFVPSEISAFLPLIISTTRRYKPIGPVLELTLEYLKRQSIIGEMLLGTVLQYLFQAVQDKKSDKFPRQNKTTRTIMLLKEFIEQHYSEQIDYTGFIALTRLSRGYLCQAFKRLTGFSPLVYLNHIRLEHARQLLADPVMNVAEVSRAVGIPDTNYFPRLFRKYMGISPTEAMRESAWPIKKRDKT